MTSARDIRFLDDVLRVDREASVWMKRGMALTREGSAAALGEALTCFDHAIALRGQIPLDALPQYHYGLAACWLNRGEALFALGGPDQLASAIGAYDVALGHLARLPFERDARVRRRLAIAWQNKGLALHAQGDIEGASHGAIQAFQQAAALLEGDAASGIENRDYMRAAISTNLANAFLALDGADAASAARDVARKAVELTTDRTDDDIEFSAVAMTARHLLCQAIARLLAGDGTHARALVNEATDAVDDGLVIARHWEQRGIDRLRALAYDLVRFGTRVYATYQPHFLNEFVLENLDPARSSGHYVGSPEMRAAALESLWLSFRTHQP